MKPKITLVFLFILPLTMFCQEVVVEHIGYQGTTNKQKEEYNRHINTIKNSFNQAKKFLDQNKNCESVQKCEQLLSQANNLMDYYNSENFEAKIARDKINNHIDAMNKYYENIGVGAHLEHDEIYERNEKYYLRHLKFRIGSYKFKINQLKSKKENTVAITASNNDFWNGKSDETKETTKSNNDDLWNGQLSNEVEENGELEIDSNAQLVYKESKKAVFPKNRFLNFRKAGDFFIADSPELENGAYKYKIDDVRRHNRSFLFDKNGKILLENASGITVTDNATEQIIDVWYNESINYSRKEWAWTTYKYYYKFSYKHIQYDFDLHLINTKSGTNTQSFYESQIK
ncbi:hypothetical protein ACFSSB_03520 [Lacinutrix gracilariae]|uniref:Uncharacterized protein n=1 Tax=Lacinutrix gracilariae TaxID=1747198 RepID=A0ABW5JZV2_9FLAO